MAGMNPVRIRKNKTVVALTIAGSDSSAGAGLQADLRIFNYLGLYGVSAVTAVTAQNTAGVTAVFPLAAEQLRSQLEALMSDRRPVVTKTGMLATTGNVDLVREYAATGELGRLVVDPVLVATAGQPLGEEGLAREIIKDLLPVCHLITPNHDEAGELTGIVVNSEEQAAQAATALVELGAGAACVTGGHFDGDAVDVLHDGYSLHILSGKRLGKKRKFHGTGCLFSAACAGYIATGLDILEAVKAAKKLTYTFIASAVDPGRGMRIPWPPA